VRAERLHRAAMRAITRRAQSANGAPLATSGSITSFADARLSRHVEESRDGGFSLVAVSTAARRMVRKDASSP